MDNTKPILWGWTEKEWAATVAASIVGAPGVIFLGLAFDQGRGFSVAIGFIAAGFLLRWCLLTAGQSK